MKCLEAVAAPVSSLFISAALVALGLEQASGLSKSIIVCSLSHSARGGRDHTNFGK